MEKVEAIKDLCSDLIFYPVIFNQDIATHLMVSAGLIENDITSVHPETPVCKISRQ